MFVLGAFRKYFVPIQDFRNLTFFSVSEHCFLRDLMPGSADSVEEANRIAEESENV